MSIGQHTFWLIVGLNQVGSNRPRGAIPCLTIGEARAFCDPKDHRRALQFTSYEAAARRMQGLPDAGGPWIVVEVPA